MRKYAIALIALLLLAALLPTPAQAGLYLPAVSAARDWFDQSDFETALRNAGYDPDAVTQFTWCEEHPLSTPESIRYSECTLDLTPDNDADTFGVRFWWNGQMNRMWWEVMQ